jgi:hypothetical protein
MNEQWDYQMLHSMDVTKGVADASAVGRKGWELVTILQPTEMVGYVLVLKRPALDPAGT